MCSVSPSSRRGWPDPISKAVLDTAELPRLLAFIDGNRLHAGLFIMLLAVALVYWLFRSKPASPSVFPAKPGRRHAGIHAGLTVVLAMAIAGAPAGLAGATQISGVLGRNAGFIAGIGFDAIAVAFRCSHRSAFFFRAARRAGGRRARVDAGVSIDLIGIIQALIIIFVAAPLQRGFSAAVPRANRKDPENG